MQFQKISILPHSRDWNFLGGGGSVRPKKLKKCVKLNWNFKRGGVGLCINGTSLDSHSCFKTKEAKDI